MHDLTFRHPDGRLAVDCDHAELGLNDAHDLFCVDCRATAEPPRWERPPVGSLVRITVDLLKPELVGQAGVVASHSTKSPASTFWIKLADGSWLYCIHSITWVEVVWS